MAVRGAQLLWIPVLGIVHLVAIFWFVGPTCGTFGPLGDGPERGSAQAALCADGQGSGLLDPLPYLVLFGSMIATEAVVVLRAVRGRSLGGRLAAALLLTPALLVVLLSLPPDLR